MDQVEKRRNIAKQVDWGTLVHTIAGLLCNRLGTPYQERFTELHCESL
jgi:hypothetical protein